MTIEEMLQAITRDNGDVLFDYESDRCRACGASALGSLSVLHEKDCMVEEAKKHLNERNECARH